MYEDPMQYKQGWLPNAFDVIIDASQKREAVRWCTFNVHPHKWHANNHPDNNEITIRKIFKFELESDRDAFNDLFGS